MKLYSNIFGPGPRRAGLYLAMKGIDDVEFVRMAAYGERSPEFLAKNPGGRIPVLELDDGSCLFESQAILQYLEEVHPQPSFHLNDEAGRQKMDVQLNLTNEFFHYFYVSALHASPVVAQYLEQSPEADKVSRPLARARLEQIAEVMGTDDFLAGDRPTIPDFTLFAIIEYIRMRFGTFLPTSLVTLTEWYDRFARLPGFYPSGFQDDEAFWEQPQP